MENGSNQKTESIDSSCTESENNASYPIDLWTAQCSKCYKWRDFQNEEEYEEIRSKATEDPFVCTKSAGVFSCEDAGDLEYGKKDMIWLKDEPDIPKPPSGFKRRILVREDNSGSTCHYEAPDGKKLKSSDEVREFLETNPVFQKNVSMADFCFKNPTIDVDSTLVD